MTRDAGEGFRAYIMESPHLKHWGMDAQGVMRACFEELTRKIDDPVEEKLLDRGVSEYDLHMPLEPAHE